MSTENLSSHKMGTVKWVYKMEVLFFLITRAALCKLRLQGNCLNQMHNIHWRKKNKNLYIQDRTVEYLVLPWSWKEENAELKEPSFREEPAAAARSPILTSGTFLQLGAQGEDQEGRKSERLRASSCIPGGPRAGDREDSQSASGLFIISGWLHMMFWISWQYGIQNGLSDGWTWQFLPRCVSATLVASVYQLKPCTS